MNSYESIERLQKLGRDQFAIIYAIGGLSHIKLQALEGRNAFAILALYNVDTENPFWICLSTTSDQPAICKSIDVAHSWLIDLGVTDFDVDIQAWAPSEVNDPHKNQVESRRRHLQNNRMASLELECLAEVKSRVPGAMISNFESDLRTLVDHTRFQAWLGSGCSDLAILSTVITLALKYGIYPQTLDQLRQYLRGLCVNTDSMGCEAHIRTMLPSKILSELALKYGEDEVSRAISDARILVDGGYFSEIVKTK